MLTMVRESLYEFTKQIRDIKTKTPRLIGATDKWGDTEEDEETKDIDIDVSDMIDTDSIDIEEDGFDDELHKALVNELKFPEFNRRIVKFRLKNDLTKILYGIPMAKMGENTFLFKFRNGSIRKIEFKNIILEEIKYNNRAITVNEENKE